MKTGTGRLALATLLLFATGCEDDPTRPGDGDAREYAVVVNSVSATVSIFPVGEPDSVRTVALDPLSTPTTIAVREGIALVPLGLFPALAVIDLEEGVVIDEIPLPANGGATGVAIVDDSLAFVANPMLNSVTPVHYRRGEAAAAIAVGEYPTGLLAIGDRVIVVEANIAFIGDTVAYGASGISVIDAETLEVDAAFALGGENAAEAATDGERLFVVNSGRFGSADASVSEVALPAAAESDLHPGFGSFASEIEVTLSGNVLVASPVTGLSYFDPDADSFIVEPGAGFGAGDANVLGFGLDASQRIWVLDAGDCASPGRAVRISAPDGVVLDEATVETCPDAIAFGFF